MSSLFLRRLASTSATQIHVNPHQFKQYLQLTDGSITYVSSLSPSRPFVKLNIDSLSHPSWNPMLRDKLLLDDHGEVAKFRKRFGSDQSDFTLVAEKFTGEIRKLDSQTKTASKSKGRPKKK